MANVAYFANETVLILRVAAHCYLLSPYLCCASSRLKQLTIEYRAYSNATTR